MAEGELFIVSAPSGAGKTSLVDALIRENDPLRVCFPYHAVKTPERAGRHQLSLH